MVFLLLPVVLNAKSKTCPEPFDTAQDKLLRRISVPSLLA
jgi:hypothetical protein